MTGTVHAVAEGALVAIRIEGGPEDKSTWIKLEPASAAMLARQIVRAAKEAETCSD